MHADAKTLGGRNQMLARDARQNELVERHGNLDTRKAHAAVEAIKVIIERENRKLRAGPTSKTPSPNQHTRSFMGMAISSMGPNVP